MENRRRSKQAGLVEETVVSSESNLTALSEAEIVRVARSIIAEVGVRGFTMRRLSTELGVALGATYHHVATKNALLALVAQDLYNDVSKPNGDVGTWEERLRSLMITQATVAAGYPGMGNFMMTHAAEIVPTDLNKLVRSILSENGFNDREMGTLMGALFYYVTGISAVFSSPTAKLFGSRKVTRLFEDGLDLLIAGAKVRQKEERKKQRS